MDKKHSERAHSITGFSGAFRWLHCTGQPALQQSLEDQGKISLTSSNAADRGTLCHEVAEINLRNNRKSIKSFIGKKKLNDVVFNVEMAESVKEVVKHAKALKKQFSEYSWEYEQQVEEIPSFPGVWGTADMTGILPLASIYVVDFKFGNRPVSPKNNLQLMVTGILLAKTNGIDLSQNGAISGVIFQPGQVPQPTPYSAEEISKVLDKMTGYFDENLAKFMSPSEDRCHFCPCRPHCEAFAGENLKVEFDPVVGKNDIDSVFPISKNDESPDIVPKKEESAIATSLSLPPAATLSPDKVADMFRFKKAFDIWYKDFVATWAPRVQKGEDIPGMKTVQGKKGTRAWAIPEDELEFYLTQMLMIPKDEVTETKVLSPAKFEKVYKEHVAHLTSKKFITQEDGKPTMALEDDKRQDYNLSNLFQNVGG